MQVIVEYDLERAIQKFKRMVVKDGIHSQIKRKLLFVKPSEKRRMKSRLAELKRRKRRTFESDFINEKAPSWRFVYEEGEFKKVLVAHEHMRQT